MSSAADSAAEPGDGRSWWVLLVQAALVAALYAPTLRLGLLSDAWVLVQQARQGLWLSVTTTTGWHYIPVATGANALLWPLFGTHAGRYQALMLLLHVLV